jgi:hypothetical protein
MIILSLSSFFVTGTTKIGIFIFFYKDAVNFTKGQVLGKIGPCGAAPDDEDFCF